MLPALESPQEISALYLDLMVLAARGHIASAYGAFKTSATDSKADLISRQLRHALEYIEANLSDDVLLEDVATASAAPSVHPRGFNASLGDHHIIGNEPSDSLIYDSQIPLSEVAASCGVADQRI